MFGLQRHKNITAHLDSDEGLPEGWLDLDEKYYGIKEEGREGSKYKVGCLDIHSKEDFEKYLAKRIPGANILRYLDYYDTRIDG